jgi:hypothetical protein
METRTFGLAAFAALVLGGCGGDTDTTCGAGTMLEGDQCVPAVVGPSGDGGGGAGGGAGQAGSDTGAPSSVGWVLFGQMFEGTPNAIGWATAAFVRVEGIAGACQILSDDGTCRLMDCPAPVSAPTQSLDAGTVRVIAEQTIELARGTDGTYSPPAVVGDVWVPGQTITVDWDGMNEDPPALSTSLEGPGPVRLVSPVAGSTITVDPNQGIPVTWQGGTVGYVDVNVPAETGQSRSFSCRWPVSDGQGTVPASVLSGLSPGNYQLAFAASASIWRSVGAWGFTVAASSFPSTVNLTLAAGAP